VRKLEAAAAAAGISERGAGGGSKGAEMDEDDEDGKDRDAAAAMGNVSGSSPSLDEGDEACGSKTTFAAAASIR